MTRIRSAAVAALIILSPILGPAPTVLAHEGLLHDGCPTGQSFAAGAITVTGAWLRATPKGAQSAGAYLTVANAASAPDTLLGASSEAASDITLHAMRMDGNVMTMTPVEGGLEVPAGGSVTLAPMGLHLMLTGMAQPFVAGQCVAMMLHFAKAGDLAIQLNIGSLTQDGPPTGADPAGEGMGGEGMGGDAMPMDHDMGGMSSMAM
jgi:copper(I)-binding protein